jgi:enamine deaminase RidA (YjgF/YER057c/UK114 family)
MPETEITVSEWGGRRRASTGRKWEAIVGYSRAVRAGNAISVTGTVGVRVDGSYDKGAAAQARRALSVIQAAIEALGGRLEDVVRTRIYVTDISGWEEIGRAHAEIFGEIRPATTMVEVSRLVDVEALVEIEADAIILL